MHLRMTLVADQAGRGYPNSPTIHFPERAGYSSNNIDRAYLALKQLVKPMDFVECERPVVSLAHI